LAWVWCLARALPFFGPMETSTLTHSATRHPHRTRRSNTRANVSWTVWARVRGQRVRFHTVDVSARGAKLRPRNDLQAGTPLTLQFVKPNGRPIRVSAMIWRVDADGLGVLFLGTTPEGLMH
jgi:PilZ domain